MLCFRILPVTVLLLLGISTAFAQEECPVNVTLTPPTCPEDADGSIAITPQRPGLYTYSWDHAPNLTASIAAGLAIGPYTVTITDTSGCITVIDTVLPPPDIAPLGSFRIQHTSCAGNDDGSITFTVDQGPYTWEWLHDPDDRSATLTNIPPGEYVVRVQGGRCPSYVFGWVADPAIRIQGPAVYCPSDTVVLHADPMWDFEPDIHLWSTGATTPDLVITPGMEGTYTVTATDTVINCVVQGSFTITMGDPPAMRYLLPDSVCARTPFVPWSLQTEASEMVWKVGDTLVQGTEPLFVLRRTGWLPVEVIAYDEDGCGNLPRPDSIYVRPRPEAGLFIAQRPCSTALEIALESNADHCTLHLDGVLFSSDCRAGIVHDPLRYGYFRFTFHASTVLGCSDTTELVFNSQLAPTLFLPSAFSPNGDGNNDTWPGPVAIPPDDYSLEVFDRWGHPLWATNNIHERWTGSNVANGHYVYMMRHRDLCNPTTHVEKTGSITLFR